MPWEENREHAVFAGSTIGEWETKLAKGSLDYVLEQITALVMLQADEHIDKVDGRSMIYFALGCAKTIAKRQADRIARLERAAKREGLTLWP